MKRKPLLFLFLIISSAQIAKAQITKGSIFLGGQVSFNRSNTNFETSPSDNKNSSFYFSPAVGVVTKNNVVWGGDVLVIYAKDFSEISETDRNQLETGIGIFSRKYFELANRFYLFAQGRLAGSYLSGKNNTPATSEGKTRGFSFGLSFYPGISYAIKKNIHFETGFYNLAYINYRQQKTTYTNPALSNIKSSQFQVGAVGYGETSFSVGIRFFLPGKS